MSMSNIGSTARFTDSMSV